MKAKLNWQAKALSALIVTVMTFNMSALPLGSIDALSDKYSGAPPGSSVSSSVSRNESESPPLSVDGIEIPTADKNPYSPEIFLNPYPIYNEEAFVLLSGESYADEEDDIIGAYQIHPIALEGHSPYYTGAITPWFSYVEGYDLNGLSGSLPYKEGKVSMLHSELVLSDYTLFFDLSGTSRRNYIEPGSFKDIYSSYMEDVHYIDKSQAYLRIGGTVLSGSGRINVLASGEWYSQIVKVEGDEPVHLYVDVPLTKIDSKSMVWVHSGDGGVSTGSVMTDFYVTLIDNQAPTLQSAKLDIIVDEETDRSSISVEMQFNEGLRFASESVDYEYDNLWIELELVDLDTKERTYAKLYLAEVDNSGRMLFKGDLGLFHYKNFRVNRISKVNLAERYRMIQRGLVDLADEFYAGAYNKIDYDNKIFTDSELYWNFKSTAIVDNAGNSINADSIVNWQFGDQKNVSNTFEAREVRLFNEITLKNSQALLEGAKVDAELTDQFVGPSRSLTAYVYMKQKLTDSEASKLYITFNILDKNGEELKAYATSWSEYKVDELYGSGVTEGTLVRFENVKLEEGMTFSEDGDGSTVLITGMYDDIPDKTAYPYLPKSITDIYADFDDPIVNLEKYASYSNVEGESGEEYYKVSVKIGVGDDDHLERYAGLIGNKMFVSIGAGVDGETPVRYVFGSDPEPPEDISGYTGEGVLSKDGYLSVGSDTLLNQYTERYLHLIFESKGVSLEDVYVNVQVSDAVGNQAKLDPTGEIDYTVDGVAPTVSFEKRSATAIDGNTKIEVKVGVSVNDLNDVVQLLYSWGEEAGEWSPVVIERGREVSGEIVRVFGDELPESNTVYEEALWVKAIDEYGNESEPISMPIALSLQKPSTSMEFDGDYNTVERHHSVIVNGPEASVFDGTDAYTRVSITPISGVGQSSVTSYVTLVKTGEVADILGFKGLTWYKVTAVGDAYAYVSEAETVGEDYVLSQDSIMYDLFTYYGEIKISFENGYGSMQPVQGEEKSDRASSGSYFEDPNYLTLRFASPYDTEREIHSVDFGSIIDRDDKVVVEDADKGADPYLFNADTRGVNPMRNTQIHFSISNISNIGYGMLDLDFEGSYAELYRVGENGADDVLISTMKGFAATDSQYFTIFNTGDDGEYFISGAYYLKVTVKSRGGHLDIYESSRLVLDAEIGEDSGVWSYSTQNYASLESIIGGNYSWSNHLAEEKPFESIGVAVTVGGEVLRNRMFASYTFGVSGLSVILSVPDPQKTYEGISVGKVAGFRVWNLLSEPTDAEIEAAGFTKERSGDYISRIAGLSEIYTAENIPKGEAGFEEMYLVKGVNTICYQILMENGYVSPIRQFNITVSDYTPELNVAIESYQPSHLPSSNPQVLNVDHIRYFIESAYSLNGDGRVEVEVWSDYGMFVGVNDGGETARSFVEDPSPQYGGQLGLLAVPGGKLSVGDYVELTENSYTSDFPRLHNLCTAVFVAKDSYGGVTIVAPQIGDARRVETRGDVAYYNEYNIDYYGSYYDDPYLIDDNFLSWRNIYNQPLYFGREFLGFESYIEKNSETGGEKYRDITDGGASLEYNIFNIVTNDIHWGFPEESSSYEAFGDAYYRPYSYVAYNRGSNFELVYWDGGTITFTGGDLRGESVTLDLKTGNHVADESGVGLPNTIGYIGASVYTGSDGVTRFTMKVAYPQATDENPAGTSVTREYTINCRNRYGDEYTVEGTVTLYYVDYTAVLEMEEYGGLLNLSFITREYGEEYRTGQYNSGSYTFKATDYYGNELEIPYEIAEDFDSGTRVILSEIKNNPGPVTVTLERADGRPIRVYVTDHAIMSVEGNETSSVTVILKDNTRFSYGYVDENGDEITKIISVENIKKPQPRIVWSFTDKSVLTDEEGNYYVYGSVTAYLVDDNYSLIDLNTGNAPKFTFNPDEAESFTFMGEQIKAVLGECETLLDGEYFARLSVTLKHIPDPLGFYVEDTETPSVQILAYSDKNGYYERVDTLLKLESAKGRSSLANYSGYHKIEFSGDRANAQRLLEAVGWGTAFRFEIQTDDTSRVKIFIKEGLYAAAPDYNTGYSDPIPGIELNSKLLTVNKNAAFSLFVVDAHNNAASIAFDINNIGEAPVPKLVKVDKGDGIIRGYLFPPEGASNFSVVGGKDVKIDSDSPVDSEYFGKYYVEYDKNDDYVINYRFTYNEKQIDGAIRVSVTEIILDEIALIDQNQPVWSENKAHEATPLAVTATASFNKSIEEIRIAGEYDEEKVSFFISGNTLTASYSENHPAIEILCFDAAGNHVTVRFDAVENIDKSAPEIKEVSRSLAKNGRALTVTFSSNERAIFKEGGYVGEQATDSEGNTVYLYTRTITQNGSYSYSFVDMSGLITVFTITVDEIVTEPLSVLYSMSFDGSDPKSDPSLLEVMVGDRFYIRPNRDATLEMSGGIERQIKADEWNEITVPESVGGILPYVIVTDEYGNVVTHQFSSVKVPDTTPPEITVKKKTVSVRVGTPRAEIEALLLQNFVAFDDMGGEVKLSVKFTESIEVIGVTEVEYIATDTEGNSATVKEKLRITSIYEPQVYYGAIKLDRGEGTIASAGEELILNIDCNGMPYMVRMKSGNRTEAQMKDGSDVVTDYTTENQISFGKLEKGIYTICIITQERDYFKIIISVE